MLKTNVKKNNIVVYINNTKQFKAKVNLKIKISSQKTIKEKSTSMFYHLSSNMP